MSSATHLSYQCDNEMFKTNHRKNSIVVILGISLILGMITVLGLSIGTLVKVEKKLYDNIDNDAKSTGHVRAFQQSSGITLVKSIYIEEVMSHLNEFQRIANAFNGTRAINTPGFNATLDYISNYLTANTNFNVTKTIFSVRPTRLARSPIFMSSINNTKINHTHSENISSADFYQMDYTTSTNFTNYIELTVISNFGCSDDDWQKTNLSSKGRVALVKRGECSFAEKSALATKYQAVALLVYNDGTAPDRFSVIAATLGENNTLPALFLTFELGQTLADAVQRAPGTVSVLIDILRLSETPFPVGNICADTPTGDATQTIVIGSHSDSVPAGPGINDNGKVTYFLCFICFSSSYDR